MLYEKGKLIRLQLKKFFQKRGIVLIVTSSVKIKLRMYIFLAMDQSISL